MGSNAQIVATSVLCFQYSRRKGRAELEADWLDGLREMARSIMWQVVNDGR
jgi:hypothetical protein